MDDYSYGMDAAAYSRGRISPLDMYSRGRVSPLDPYGIGAIEADHSEFPLMRLSAMNDSLEIRRNWYLLGLNPLLAQNYSTNLNLRPSVPELLQNHPSLPQDLVKQYLWNQLLLPLSLQQRHLSQY